MESFAISLATSLATSLNAPHYHYNLDYDFEEVSSNPFEVTASEPRQILSAYRDMRTSLTLHVRGVYNGKSFDYANPYGLPFDESLNGWKSYNAVLDGKLLKFSYNDVADKWYLLFDVS